MLGIELWPPGLAMNGAFALPVWAAGALAALLVCLVVVAFQRSVHPGTIGTVWRGALVLSGVALAWILLSFAGPRDTSLARRALEARANELTLRALEPGSTLACLDGVVNPTIEDACEKALFASPEKIAAAVSYVDARLALLADGLALAARDPVYAASLERVRRALEGDRFGFVAHVLTTRGCSAEKCDALKLLRDPGRVAANLKERTFDANVIQHAANWHSEGPAVAAAPQLAPLVAPATPAPSVASTGTPSGVPVSGKYSFPSASSIPAVSIMNAEPTEPAATEAAPAPKPATPAKPPAAPARRQTQREPPVAPPQAIVPLPAPPPPPPAPGNAPSFR